MALTVLKMVKTRGSFGMDSSSHLSLYPGPDWDFCEIILVLGSNRRKHSKERLHWLPSLNPWFLCVNKVFSVDKVDSIAFFLLFNKWHPASCFMALSMQIWYFPHETFNLRPQSIPAVNKMVYAVTVSLSNTCLIRTFLHTRCNSKYVKWLYIKGCDQKLRLKSEPQNIMIIMNSIKTTL